MAIVNQILMPCIATVLTGLITWGVKALIAWIKTKTNAAIFDDMLTSADRIITNSVAEVSQTFVDNLKKEGKFDTEAQKEALQQAYNKIDAQLTDCMKIAMQSRCTDLTAYIITLIEGKVKESK